MYKALKGYEGFYEVNEFGKIRSIDRKVKSKDGIIMKFKGRDLKPEINKKGYLIVRLSKNGIAKTRKVHRLVAETFLSNIDNLPEIHHKNHDRKDNRIQNLKWVSKDEQLDEHWRMAQSNKTGARLRVVGHGIDKIYNSAKAVQRELGIDNSNALKVAKGKYKQAKGYRIYFANQETETNNEPKEK